jgi:hypothetical protein
MEALRTPQLLRPLNGSPGLPQDNDRILRLLPHRKATKEDSVEDQGSTAAAIEEKLNEELRAVVEEVNRREASLEGHNEAREALVCSIAG